MRETDDQIAAIRERLEAIVADWQLRSSGCHVMHLYPQATLWAQAAGELAEARTMLSNVDTKRAEWKRKALAHAAELEALRRERDDWRLSFETTNEAVGQAEAENARLREALKGLIVDVNRLCDRQLGGTYEEDCRRSIAGARAALSSSSAGKEE